MGQSARFGYSHLRLSTLSSRCPSPCPKQVAISVRSIHLTTNDFSPRCASTRLERGVLTSPRFCESGQAAPLRASCALRRAAFRFVTICYPRSDRISKPVRFRCRLRPKSYVGTEVMCFEAGASVTSSRVPLSGHHFCEWQLVGTLPVQRFSGASSIQCSPAGPWSVFRRTKLRVLTANGGVSHSLRSSGWRPLPKKRRQVRKPQPLCAMQAMGWIPSRARQNLNGVSPPPPRRAWPAHGQRPTLGAYRTG